MVKNIFKPQIVGAFLCLLSICNVAVSGQYAIASAHPLATKAGIEILQQGGNDGKIQTTAQAINRQGQSAHDRFAEERKESRANLGAQLISGQERRGAGV